jgi:hypothetical protein
MLDIVAFGNLYCQLPNTHGMILIMDLKQIVKEERKRTGSRVSMATLEDITGVYELTYWGSRNPALDSGIRAAIESARQRGAWLQDPAMNSTPSSPDCPDGLSIWIIPAMSSNSEQLLLQSLYPLQNEFQRANIQIRKK